VLVESSVLVHIFKSPLLELKANCFCVFLWQRSLFRTLLMFGFHFLVWFLCVRGVRDTQCGFKLFSRPAARLLFWTQHVERWFVLQLPPIGKGAVSIGFVCPSVPPSVTYIANNSRTQRPSVPKFGRKVPHLSCDWATHIPVSRSKVQRHQAH